MVSQNIQSQASSKGSYYLNDFKTLETLKGHAARTPMVVETKCDKSMSLQFSTGAYMEAVSPLVSFWKRAEGRGEIDKVDTDGMVAKVATIETTTDNGGKTVSTVIKLDVEGEKVTVTCFDTQVYMRVQGKHQMEEFFKRALLPYLKEEISSQANQIKEINLHFRQLGNSDKTRNRGNKTDPKTKPAYVKRKTNFKPSKIRSEQQLEESDMESTEDDDSIIIVERDKTVEKPNQVAIIPDESFCLENNLTPAPRAVWSEISLPKGWKASNNVLTGRSLPSSDLAALLEAVHGLSRPGEVTLDESSTPPPDNGLSMPATKVVPPERLEGGPESAGGLDVSQSPPTTEAESPTRLVGGHKSAGGLDVSQSPPATEVESPTRLGRGQGAAQGLDKSLPPSVVGSPEGLEGGPTSATGLVPSSSTPAEGQRPAGGLEQLLLDSLQPAHDTTGNVMRFLSEMRKQSERLSKMEKREGHMETMLEVQGQMIANLQESVQQVVTQLKSRHSPSLSAPREAPLDVAEALPVDRAPQPPGGLRFPRAPRPATVLQDQPAASSSSPALRQEATNGSSEHQRPTLKCDTCGHLATNKRRMSNHVGNMHSGLKSGSTPLTLLVGDSHMNSLNLRQVEEALGRKARLIAPGSVRPREDRAYCSSPDWPGARFPQNSLQQMVPEQLGEREYTNLILLAPTNDITNLREIVSRKERERLAVQSAKNTIRVAEEALKSVEKVLIMEQPLRVDDMAELSEFSKRKLRELAKSCPLAGRIKIGSSRPDIISSDEKKKEVFGKPTDRGVDGIHMRGAKGKKFLSETVIEAIKYNGLADKDSRVGGGRRPAHGLERQDPGWSTVEGGVRTAPRLDAQRSWASLASNQYYSLSN